MQTKLQDLQGKIGRTPLLQTKYSNVYVKYEAQNPAGSIKDRAAYFIIRRAIECGALKEGMSIVEATSGNTGIGLAYVGKQLGFKVIITMPDSMTGERVDLLKKHGATLVLTPGAQGMNGAVARAKEIAAEGGFFANQFGNPANAEAHFLTTAPEVFGALPTADYIVAGIGSGGTVMGFRHYVDANQLDCKVIGVEPARSPLLTKGHAGKHDIEGIGANFVPDLLNPSLLDEIIDIDDDEAYATTARLAKEENLRVGASSGAAFAAALKVHSRDESKQIVVILPDGEDRYPASMYQ